MTTRRLALAIVGLALAASPAGAASSIVTTQPVQGVPYSAAPIRQNFQNAAGDITALQSLNAGATAPASPESGELWLNTPQSSTLYTLEIWNARQSEWLPTASFDSLNNLWIPPVGGGLPVSLLADNTTDLGSVPNTVISITGPGPIYSFGSTTPAGQLKVIQFDGATQIVYNPTSMILPGAADLNTGAGDIAIATALGSGNWQVLFLQASALTVPQGGTGRTSLTAHTVLVGAGTSPINFAGPGAAGVPLVGAGVSADPTFSALDIGGAGVTGTLAVPHGGTGLAAVTAHNLLVGNGTSTLTLLPPDAAGLPLVSQGATIDPAYAALDVVGGGTGATTLAAHGVLLGEGTATLGIAAPGTAGLPLVSAGASSDPIFAALNLSTSVTGQLPLTNIANIANDTVLGNVSGGSAPPVALTQTQLTTLVNSFTSGLAGAAPASGGGTVNFLRADGTWQPPPSTPSVGGEQYYGTPGTYTFTVPAAAVRVKCWGAGGGSGGTNGTSVSSGGGGGGFAEGAVSGLTVGGSITITVGAGGTAGSPSPTDGGAGGASSFGSYITCNGGTGSGAAGGVISVANGLGGSSTGGEINLSGQPGATPVTISAGNYLSGSGGASPFGGGTSQFASGALAELGITGIAPGGGAGGGLNGGAGGAGGAGAVIITW